MPGSSIDRSRTCARSDTDAALGVAHDHQGGKAEPTATLHHLGDTVDADKLFYQIALFTVAATAPVLTVAVVTAVAMAHGTEASGGQFTPSWLPL